MTTRLVSFEGTTHHRAHIDDDGDTYLYDAYDGAAFHLTARTGRLRVLVEGLDPDTGCWNLSIGPCSEAHPMPNWPVTIGPGVSDISGKLSVSVPTDTLLTVE